MYRLPIEMGILLMGRIYCCKCMMNINHLLPALAWRLSKVYPHSKRRPPIIVPQINLLAGL